MRIMIVDPGFDYSTLAVAEAYYDAFVARGYEVIEYDTNGYYKDLKVMMEHVGRKFKWMEITEHLSSFILNHIIQDRIDAIVVIHGWHINPSIINSARRLGCKTALILTDEPQQTDISVQWSSHYDYTFSNERNTVNRHHNCSFLPTAANTEIFYPRDVELKYKSDILFGGSFYKERIEFVMNNSLYEIIKNRDVKCVGARRFNTDHTDARCNWFVENKIDINTMSEYVAGAKIAIDIPRNEFICGIFGETNKMKINATNLSPRIYECALSNCLVLTDDSREDIKDLFPKDLFPTYSNLNDLNNMLNHFLDNEHIRLELVKRQREYCLENHTYDNRVKKIENKMDLKPSKKLEGYFSKDSIMNEKVVESFNKDWAINITKNNNLGIYKKENSLEQLKDTKIGEEAILASNGTSLEDTYIQLIDEISDYKDVFCLNQTGKQLDKLKIRWKNLIVIHPNEDVYGRAIKDLDNIENKILFSSSVAYHKCLLDWVNAQGKLILFNTSECGHKRLVNAFIKLPVLGAGITVAYSALTILKYLGYKKIKIFGLDFSYNNYKEYAFQKLDFKKICRLAPELMQSYSGNPILTNLTFLQSLKSCKDFISANRDIEFISYGDNLLYDNKINNLKNIL